MANLFAGKTFFDYDISAWNTASVVTFENMFKGAKSFNRDLSRWVTSAVTTTEGMFAGATAFNSAIGSWDMSSVTTMRDMFNGAAAFNQDLSEWHVPECTNFESTFVDANAMTFTELCWSLQDGAYTDGPDFITACPPTSAPTVTSAPSAEPTSVEPTITSAPTGFASMDVMEIAHKDFFAKRTNAAFTAVNAGGLGPMGAVAAADLLGSANAGQQIYAGNLVTFVEKALDLDSDDGSGMSDGMCVRAGGMLRGRRYPPLSLAI